MVLLEISGIGLGYIFTSIFLSSLGLLYFIDYKFKSSTNTVYYSNIALGGVVIFIFLIFLVFSCKTIINGIFTEIEQNTVYRFLVFGIMWGIITFPFMARKLQNIILKRK